VAGGLMIAAVDTFAMPNGTNMRWLFLISNWVFNLSTDHHQARSVVMVISNEELPNFHQILSP